MEQPVRPSGLADPTRTAADWSAGLPDLIGETLTLRELRPSDAPSMFAEMSTPEVKRFMWAPPPSVEAFERFIEWSYAERATGKYICYGVVPHDIGHALGVFELRQMQPGFFRGELGFVLASQLWGSGAFTEGARLMIDFAFRVVHVHRIEARAAVDNSRGNAALRKIGATREGTLKEAFWRDGQFIDQYLWSILDTRWDPDAQLP